jgi:cytochrome d ubiquinol oxidase subunit I
MQTPAGFHVVGEGLTARAEILDFWAMVFNPSSVVRLQHTVVGCWLAGAFLVISVAAYYFLRRRHPNFSRTSLKVGLSISLVSCVLQLILGDLSAKIVAEYQPAKLAAMEGIYQTKQGAPIYIFGFPNDAEATVNYGLAVPNMLSFLTYGDFTATIQGLDKVPRQDWPRVPIVFQSYHIMLYMWALMLAFTLAAIYMWWRNTLFTSKWMLRGLVLSVLFPQIANQAGWMTAEVGRYPWIVYNLLRISEGLSRSVTAGQILGSLIMFTIVYILLFALFILLLDHKIKAGPTDEDVDDVYHNQELYLKELER